MVVALLVVKHHYSHGGWCTVYLQITFWRKDALIVTFQALFENVQFNYLFFAKPSPSDYNPSAFDGR